MRSRAGDWVEVASKEEILATLDKQGRLDDMPFMPEMFACCGKRLRVHKRAHKACDTLKPVGCLSRKVKDAVLLEGVRCSGAAHGGCQAACSVFWKEAWLKPVDGPDGEATAPHAAVTSGAGCTEEDVVRAAVADDSNPKRIRYQCQTTDFRRYSECVRTRDVRQYLEDLTSRNVTLKSMVLTACYYLCKLVGRPKWEGDGGPYAKVYDWFQGLWGGAPFPRKPGLLKEGEAEPVEDLNLQPGELVRVKPYDAIRATISKDNMNRGLYFDGEMMPYCGGAYRVRARVDHFLDENTGYMRRMKTPAVILEGVWCRSHYTPYRVFCPRAIHSWWREAWLERAPDATEPSAADALGAREILKSLAEDPSPLALDPALTGEEQRGLPPAREPCPSQSVAEGARRG